MRTGTQYSVQICIAPKQAQVSMIRNFMILWRNGLQIPVDQVHKPYAYGGCQLRQHGHHSTLSLHITAKLTEHSRVDRQQVSVHRSNEEISLQPIQHIAAETISVI